MDEAAFEAFAKAIWRGRICAVVLCAIGGCVAVFTACIVPSTGIAIGILGAAAGIMSVRPPEMRMWERLTWIVLLVALLTTEIRSIRQSEAENLQKIQNITAKVTNTDANVTVIKGIVEGISRPSSPSNDKQSLIALWGMLSQFNSRQIAGATTGKPHPLQQTGRRAISIEALAKDMKGSEPSAATVINDGTNESGNFAQQLVRALQDGGWQAGGNNVKTGDPDFFPDNLTLEISAVPASTQDHSKEEARTLQKALEKQGIKSVIRETDLKFPTNFMRIKIAEQ